MTGAPVPQYSSGSATALERATAQFEALRNAYRGYMPWGSENADIKTRLLQIEDMDKAFFAAMAMLSAAQGSPERRLTDAMVQAAAKALNPLAFDVDERGNYLVMPVARREARKQAREIVIAALSALPSTVLCPPTVKKCAAAWLCEPQYRGVTVLDPDGWDRRNYDQSWAEEITEDEFKRRLMVSTSTWRSSEHSSTEIK